MFEKKEKVFEDNITHSTVKLLMDRLKFLSFRTKLALIIGIVICVFTLVYSLVLTLALPNVDITVAEQEKWIASVPIIRVIGIIVVGLGAVFTFLDIFNKVLPETLEKNKPKAPKKKTTTKKPAKKKE